MTIIHAYWCPNANSATASWRKNNLIKIIKNYLYGLFSCFNIFQKNTLRDILSFHHISFSSMFSTRADNGLSGETTLISPNEQLTLRLHGVLWCNQGKTAHIMLIRTLWHYILIFRCSERRKLNQNELVIISILLTKADEYFIGERWISWNFFFFDRG